MFVVAVENVEDGDQRQDPIVLVRASWLTPKKQECFWPPCKHSEKFNATLSRTKDPGEDWSLIKIKRRLYETDDLVKARKKAREAEYESDLLTDDLLEEETSSSLRRSKRRRSKREQYSPEVTDDEDDSSNEAEKVPDINFPYPPSSNLLDQPPANNIESSITTHLPSQPVYTPTDGNSPFRNYSDQPPVNNTGSSNTAHLPSQPVDTPTDGNSLLRNYSSGFKVLLRRIENLTEVVEENNKLLHVLLVEKKTAEDSPQIDNNCPFPLPLQTLQDVEDFEDLLKDSEKRKNFVTHLAIIGGVNAEKHVRRILCSVFTNELAQKFNWVGKGDKKALKDTIFPSIIIDAVKRNKKFFAGTTICELENTIKQWFRFAKDRCGGRDKRRSQNQDNTARN